MLKSGFVNPALLERLACVRQPVFLASAGRGFPCWPQTAAVDRARRTGIRLVFKPHPGLKKRGPSALGPTRPGDNFSATNRISEAA